MSLDIKQLQQTSESDWDEVLYPPEIRWHRGVFRVARFVCVFIPKLLIAPIGLVGMAFAHLGEGIGKIHTVIRQGINRKIDDPLVEWWNQKFHAAHGYASRKEMFRDIERQAETLEDGVDNPCVNGKTR